jgi:hypothetical protein
MMLSTMALMIVGVISGLVPRCARRSCIQSRRWAASNRRCRVITLEFMRIHLTQRTLRSTLLPSHLAER